jgi:hypothetical protein
MPPILWTGLAQLEDIPSIQSAAHGPYWVAVGALRSQPFRRQKLSQRKELAFSMDQADAHQMVNSQ